jgi:hypothetical protein
MSADRPAGSDRGRKAKRPKRDPTAEATSDLGSASSQSASTNLLGIAGLTANGPLSAAALLGMSSNAQQDARIPFHAPMSIPDLAMLNASIARSILLREQEMANRQLQHFSMMQRAASSNEGLAMQFLRQQQQQQHHQHQQAYGSLLQPQLLQRQSLMLSQLQAMSSPRGPPSVLLPSASPRQPSVLDLPPTHSAMLPGGRTGMNLGAGVVQPAPDSLTSALASIAHEEARRKSDRDRPNLGSVESGGGGGGGGGGNVHPNGCVYHPRAFPVSVESDKDCTSKYQAFLRQQLMYFETVPLDTQASAKGRNKPIKVGQVGIMCRHCRNVPPPKRPRGSVYYPQKLVGVYQSAQNMAKNHFAGSGCANAPSEVNDELHRLRAEQTSFYGGGQPYWAKSAAMAGIIETEDGLELAPSSRLGVGGISSGSRKGGTT